MSNLNPPFSVSLVNSTLPIKYAAPGQSTSSVLVGLFTTHTNGIDSNNAEYQYSLNFVSDASHSYNNPNQALFPHFSGSSGINLQLSA